MGSFRKGRQRAAALVAAGLLASLTAAAPAQAAPDGQLTVYTQNQYVGANLRPLFPQTPQDQPTYQASLRKVVNQIKANRFDKRVLAQAVQIRLANPDVVALQEVYDLTKNGQHDKGAFRDHLAEILAALAKVGAQYEVAAVVPTLAVELPADLDGNGSLEANVGLTDRNVLLVRKGIAATPVPLADRCDRPAREGSGCLFLAVTFVETSAGRKNVDHGYVGIDLSVNGRDYRVVTTRLEERDALGNDTLSPVFQSREASELLTILEKALPGNRLQVVLGDFASRPDDTTVVVGDVPLAAPHAMISGSGYQDRLTPEFGTPGRKVCCQREDLRSPISRLDHQVDAVFVSHVPDSTQIDLLGDTTLEWALGGKIWPSDHASVVTRMRFGVSPPPAPKP